MLEVTAKLPTKKLLIRRVLPKLFQSFIYTSLDNKEHSGYKHPNGKIFKAMNFKIDNFEDEINIKYVALDKENEKRVAQKILLDGLKLGEIHIARTDITLSERSSQIGKSIKVGGFVSAAIKDGRFSKKKIYLEPRSDKFQEIIHNNTLEKYQVLFGKPYEGQLTINLINQKPKERLFHYSRGTIKAWYGAYEIVADRDMLEMILDTGMGANCMKGIGFLELA